MLVKMEVEIKSVCRHCGDPCEKTFCNRVCYEKYRHIQKINTQRLRRQEQQKHHKPPTWTCDNCGQVYPLKFYPLVYRMKFEQFKKEHVCK